MPNKQTKHRKKKNSDKESVIKANPETLHTTDPQEHMKGPVSSMMHGIEETMEDTGSKSKDEPKQKQKK
jgi:hypothetical protein